MKRRLPPLNALRAFEAAARHLSFNRAADELNVTPAAVSQQVRALEEWLGIRLFRRQPRGVLLTDAAQIYWPILRELFDRLDEETRKLVQRPRSDTFTISTTASIAERWLIPRLGRLQAQMSDVEIRVMASTSLVDFATDDVDVALRFGSGRYPGLQADHLMPGDAFAVCSPRLLSDPERPLRTPHDLCHHVLLHDDLDVFGALPELTWLPWLTAVGVSGVDGTRGPRFSYTSMALQAAVDGQGVALATLATAVDDLVAGRLVRPFPHVVASPHAYWIVYPEERSDRPDVAAFRKWALAEAEPHIRPDPEAKIIPLPPQHLRAFTTVRPARR